MNVFLPFRNLLPLYRFLHVHAILGEFSWDGFEEAAKHWDKVEGGREKAEAQMQERK